MGCRPGACLGKPAGTCRKKPAGRERNPMNELVNAGLRGIFFFYSLQVRITIPMKPLFETFFRGIFCQETSK